MLAQYFCIVNCIFSASISVKMPTNCIKFYGYFRGCSITCTFESHMLKKVRDAILVGRLVARACANPYPDRRRGQPRHMFCHDAKAVFQAIGLRSHWLRFSLMWVISAARSALRIVTPPTLTPRSSATHAVMTDLQRELEAEARGEQRHEVARHLAEVRRGRREVIGRVVLVWE